MKIKYFIEKWNVAHESKEQEIEFASKMESDLKSLINSDFELQRLYEWLREGNTRQPANTKFTAGLTRNIAREFEYLLANMPDVSNSVCEHNGRRRPDPLGGFFCVECGTFIKKTEC